MKISTTRRFDRDYVSLSEEIKNLLDRKLKIFVTNQNHPSLRVKKMEGHPSIWEASINIQYSFTFEIKSNVYILRRVGIHDILKTP